VSDAVVSALSVTPVKGFRIQQVEEIELGVGGARGDRRFYVIDERGQMRNGKQIGPLQSVVASFSDETGELTFAFPNGRGRVSGTVELGERIATRFFSRPREDQLVIGPWADALSEFTGQALRLVATGSASDRGERGRASLISRASLARLASVAEVESVDGRRFRMLIEVDGVEAHVEDEWVGREVRVGSDAVIRWLGNVGRCLVTGRDPETGVPTLETLDLLGEYRREVETTEPLPFGIYGEVLVPGRIRMGDPVVASLTA
jgi:uncharacterized protein YcbX